jgi:Ca2+-binding RTX toxin-like protein
MTTTLPPPSGLSFDSAIPLPTPLGTLVNGYFPSYYVRNLTTSTTRDFFYKFGAPNDGLNLRLWTFSESPGFSSYITLYNAARTTLGNNADNVNPVSPPINVSNGVPFNPNGPIQSMQDYYAAVNLDAGGTTSWGVVAYPRGLTPDLAGSTKATAEAISFNSQGRWSKVDTFLTVYERKEPTSGNTLEVDRTRQVVNDDTDFFRFTLATPAAVTITPGGQRSAVILHGDAQGPIGSPVNQLISGSTTVQLNAGTYYLEALSTGWQVTGAGINSARFRQPWETYDVYSLTVSMQPNNGTGGTVDLSAAIRGVEVDGRNGAITYNSGDLALVHYSLFNSGSVATGAGVVGFYLSTDATITTSDRFLGQLGLDSTIPSGGRLDVATYTALPADLPSGRYYLGIRADHGQTIVETNENNNFSGGWIIDVWQQGGGTFTGDANPNVIYGRTGNDWIDAAGGDDTVFGGPGGDVIFAGGGNDLIAPGGGNDVIDGGPGSDTLDYRGVATGMTLVMGSLGPNSGQVFAGEPIGMDTFSNIEHVLCGDGSDVVGCDGNGNYVFGGGGNETIFGWTGNDFLQGGDGADTLFGQQDDDRLEGQNGDDWLFGWAGNDSLHGGQGADHFVWTGPGEGTDKILDYSYAAGDVIHIVGNPASFRFGQFGTDVLILDPSGQPIFQLINYSLSSGLAIV